MDIVKFCIKLLLLRRAPRKLPAERWQLPAASRGRRTAATNRVTVTPKKKDIRIRYWRISLMSASDYLYTDDEMFIEAAGAHTAAAAWPGPGPRAVWPGCSQVASSQTRTARPSLRSLERAYWLAKEEATRSTRRRSIGNSLEMGSDGTMNLPQLYLAGAAGQGEVRGTGYAGTGGGAGHPCRVPMITRTCSECTATAIGITASSSSTAA